MIWYGNLLQMCQQCNLCNMDTLGLTKITLLIKVTSFSMSESIIWDHKQVCTLCGCPYLQVLLYVYVNTIIKLIHSRKVCISMQNMFTSTECSNSYILIHTPALLCLGTVLSKVITIGRRLLGS